MAVLALTAEAFIRPRLPGEMVLRRDCDPLNDRPSNVVFGNASTAALLREANGHGVSGEKHHAAKLSATDVAEIRAAVGVETQKATAAKFGVHLGTVAVIQQGKTHRYDKAA